jgi:hypothetical protein
MKTDNTVKREGFLALKDRLGAVDMARFLVLVNRERLDYVNWRKELHKGMDLDALADAADGHSRTLRSSDEKP